jgi:hypothetical protein
LGRINVSSQSYLRIIDPRLAASLSRSYYTALNVIGDKVSAEALVMEAIESLDPENVTGETLRDAVVDVLVRVQGNLPPVPTIRHALILIQLSLPWG